MCIHYRFGLFLVFSALTLAPPAGARDAAPAEVLVYGATPAGIAASVSAAKAGRSVLLVEPTARIGGLMTNGLSYSDFRSFESLTGFFLNFSRRVEADYRARYGADSAQMKDSFRGTHGEPSVNLRVFQQMLAEHPRVRVVSGHTLVRVELSDFVLGRRRIVAAHFATADGPRRIAAAQFVDTSYEGDLMAAAGESYHLGRESRAQYGEPLAGNARGEADGQVQGYNLRLIMTERDDNKLMPVAPEDYRREDFTGILPLFASGRLTKAFSSNHDGIYRAHLMRLPNEKWDVNDTPRAPVRLSLPDINDAYPDGDAPTRARIVREHFYHNLGLIYFLQNDAAVPAAIRDDARRYGWCRDEFNETGGVATQIYIREARRLVGQHIFTGNDTKNAPHDARTLLRPDAIAIGDYVHNCHGTGRTGTRYDGTHEGEFYHNVPPYQIAYGTIVPQKTENLLVPVACSASHFGFSALRLEAIWSALGQAAGHAAHLALERATPVQKVDVQALQRRLHADGSAALYVSDVPPGSQDFAAVQWFGLRGALHGLAPAGQPQPRSIGSQYTEAFPGHAADLAAPLTPELRARWTALLPAGTPAPAAAATATRGDFIRIAHAALSRQ